MDKVDTQDFNSTLQRHGYKQTDFDIAENDKTQWNSNEGAPITGVILITLKKTGKSKEYRTGMGTKWIIAFENDLASGAFE